QALPVGSKGCGKVAQIIGDVAQLSYGTMPGEVDRYNQQRMITITGNIGGDLAGSDLGNVASKVNEAIKRTGDVPRGVTVAVRGQVPAMQQALTGLGTGLLLAVVT